MEPIKPTESQKKLWFHAKTYGWGWGAPASWEGWVVYATYVVFVIWVVRDANQAPRSTNDTLVEFTVPLIVATAILVAICYAKGEKPRWRWGK